MARSAAGLAARRQPVTATAPERHTMGDRLADYVLPKVPVADLCACDGRVLVTPTASLAELVEPHKLGTKLFNRLRPTWYRENGSLVCGVIPGVDYSWHYARLAATAASMLGFEPAVILQRPRPDAAREFIGATMPSALRVPEVVIVGYVEQLFPSPAGTAGWRLEDGFGWRHQTISGQPVALVGCEFSYWGDLAGAVVAELADRGARWVIYVGKLGTLTGGLEPNHWVATGTSSLVDGHTVRWASGLKAAAQLDSRVLVDQRHITVASIVDETLTWFDSALGRFQLVDPEIGRMAAAARAAGIAYDYAHIVTDNLTGHYNAGLYRERSPDVRADRGQCLALIESTITKAIA